MTEQVRAALLAHGAQRIEKNEVEEEADSFAKLIPKRWRSKTVLQRISVAVWSYFVYSVLLCLTTTLVLMKAAFFDGNSAVIPSKPAAGDFRRSGADYILSDEWDFDAVPTVREYNWTIKEIEASPDGVMRPMLTINGKFPGELVRCNEGDTIVVNIENNSTNATSIHWHGILQNGTNWMDGTSGVTQCPVAPGRKFQYKFTVKGQAGTCKSFVYSSMWR
jgi:hypothetical protein